MNQCLIVHGGEVFDTEEQWYAFLEARELDPTSPPRGKWRDRLKHALSFSDRQVFLPQMPNAQQATYKAWKIWFEKYLPFIVDDHIVLVGHSLGGWFLCKWLSENKFPTKIHQLHLVATSISHEGREDAGCADFGFDHTKLVYLEQQCTEIYLYHSLDDEIVPFSQAELLKSYLPNAQLIAFETRGHFLQPALPELLENMRVYSK